MRLDLVVILFTCLLGFANSAPYTRSDEALLQEIRKLVAKEESHESTLTQKQAVQKQAVQKKDGVLMMYICAQTGQGAVTVTPEDVQRAVAKAKAQEKISAIIGGISAAAAVGSLGTGINSAVNGQEKRNAKMTAQEKISAIIAGVGAAAAVGGLGTNIATSVGDQSVQDKATSQEKISLIIAGVGAAAGVGSLGTGIAGAVNDQQLAAGKGVQVPLSDMLCTPIALGAFEATP